MKVSVVMTVLAADRTGIVKRLSETVADHAGNWLESRMARLAGQFAGILRVECEEEGIEELVEALEALASEGISVQVQRESHQEAPKRAMLTLDVVGNDRPGIVKALSAAIASAGANVEDLHTALESAPMSGHPLFHAKGIVSLPDGLSPGALVDSIESLGEDLAVSVE
ncbi:glycine cleavage system protein R [Haloferula chungangensis]|uniref:Glycine cleavage system protein R n=1 Tax=Haloferula chungangensis TaxID=1048331 RepID=A0ABW2LA32_9BACT